MPIFLLSPCLNCKTFIGVYFQKLHFLKQFFHFISVILVAICHFQGRRRRILYSTDTADLSTALFLYIATRPTSWPSIQFSHHQKLLHHQHLFIKTTLERNIQTRFFDCINTSNIKVFAYILKYCRT